MSGFCCCTNLIVELILIRRIVAVSHKNLPHGGESRDIFCTNISTERVRKVITVSLIFNEFSRGKEQIPYHFCSKPI